MPPTAAWDTYPHGLMFWLQMGRHKEEAMDTNSTLARSPPVIEEEFRKEQRDSTCVTESQRWQEERQAQLCLARMPAVVPDTRPAPHQRGGKPTLKVIICMHAT